MVAGDSDRQLWSDEFRRSDFAEGSTAAASGSKAWARFASLSYWELCRGLLRQRYCLDRQQAPATIESKQTAPLGPFCFAATKDSVGSTARSARPVLATIGSPVSHDSMESRPAQAALLVKSMSGDAPVVLCLDARRASARRRGSAVTSRHGPSRPGQRTGCRKVMSIESTDV